MSIIGVLTPVPNINGLLSGGTIIHGTLSGETSLVGSLTSESTLNGRLSANQTLVGTLSIPLSADANVYDGDYVVTPKVAESTVLATKSKVMRDDVTVKEIPLYETTNPSGGTTVYIAMEII